ncbi:MAG: hypothetical protein ACERKN_01330 [Velocimicrobium sp.]
MKLSFKCFVSVPGQKCEILLEEMDDEKRKHMVERGTVAFMKELNITATKISR